MIQSRFNAFFLSLAGARHRGAATLAALALVLVAAGCGFGGGSGGGGSELTKAQYEQHLQTDSQAITKAFTPLRKPPRSLNELAGELKVGEAKLREASADLNSVKPPKEVQQRRCEERRQACAEGAERTAAIARARRRSQGDRRHEEEGLQARSLGELRQQPGSGRLEARHRTLSHC